ncbi:histidine kinase 2-like [Nicotiana tabacum]|uniref:Histidine kinase 2-like n=4 Tax=Nicotiana tabacum TaxID=4097 RepID=A0AC58U7W8_TOBAC
MPRYRREGALRLMCPQNSMERDELKSAHLVDYVLTKPLRPSVLISCFQETLGFGNKRHIKRGKLPTRGSLLKGIHILGIDDNVVNRRVAEGALKKYRAISTCVDSRKAALALFMPPHKYDTCFMDLQMP